MVGRRHNAARVLVFAKYPTPGRVKTRLMTDISAEQAASVHRVLVCGLLERLSRLPAALRLELCGDRPAGAAFYSGLLSQYPCMQFSLQRGNDLGCRMNFALRSALIRSARVILVGSDCPDLNATHVLALQAALTTHDVALIGAEDGGYVAIALKAPQPCLFRGIDWGTSAVLEQTLRAARRNRLRAQVVATLADLDEISDLQRFAGIAQQAGCEMVPGAGSH
ncbi:TIGR04282 family arsenosugar biosynthesis glycosyltransferase [Granulosicoccaceae sp. 1_MG-2023]|nr:TIGR04282 family arsenosugar biosynthesis glycosyltransferase [Granulosicoccaceae sp. 1_MG-2023]